MDLVDWLIWLTDRIHWEALGIVVTTAAVLAAIWAALLPGRREEKRRQAEARTLRTRLVIALHPVMATFAWLLDPEKAEASEVVFNELDAAGLRRAVDRVDELLLRAYVLEPDEQDKLSAIFSHASFWSDENARGRSVQENACMKIVEDIHDVTELFEKHGYHATNLPTPESESSDDDL